MSFVRRLIEATITLGVGEFGDTLGNTMKIKGLRMQVLKTTYGHESMGSLQLRIFGLPLADINRLTTIGPIATEIRGKNRVMVSAGNEGAALSKIFEGTIYQAWADFNSAPEVAFNITALAGLDAALKPVSPSSFQGSADAADILKGLAEQMGLTFENNHVSVVFSNPYFPGTVLEQVKMVCRAGNIRYLIENGILAVWPARGVRAGEVPRVSPFTGLVGYPSFTSSGITLQTLFTPQAVVGGKVKVDSSLTPACGEWPVTSVVHELECETPGGQWFTTLTLAQVTA